MESKDCSGCGYFSPDFYEHNLSLFWSGHFLQTKQIFICSKHGNAWKTLERHSISWKPLRFASWFPALISCSPNLPRVYVRLWRRCVFLVAVGGGGGVLRPLWCMAVLRYTWILLFPSWVLDSWFWSPSVGRTEGSRWRRELWIDVFFSWAVPDGLVMMRLARSCKHLTVPRLADCGWCES